MTENKRAEYKKAYNHVKKMLHVCSPIETASYKHLMNYYYSKLEK